jgi:hypothetical protein
MGMWGQRWIEASDALGKTRSCFFHVGNDTSCSTRGRCRKRRCTVLFQYPDQKEGLRKWWLVVVPGTEIDVCVEDPGFDVDLYVTTDLRTMTAVWMGLTTVHQALRLRK